MSFWTAALANLLARICGAADPQLSVLATVRIGAAHSHQRLNAAICGSLSLRAMHTRDYAARFIPLLTVFSAAASAAVLHVGPGQKYATPCKAIAAAKPGERIEIDATGNYRGDVCAWKTNNLTLVGVNGRPKIDAGGRSSQGKAIWVISGDDTTVENLEFTGAAVPDHNGAGIRLEGANLTVHLCYFHDNQEGILTGANSTSRVLVENTEFGENGYSDGQAHNIYVGRIAEFTLRFSYSHDAISGHLVKSRALRNFILYNRLSEESGTGSYELDLPNGGLSYVMGNLIEQGPLSENSTIVAFGEEGASNPDSALYFVNNTVVNHRSDGIFIGVNPRVPPPLIQNNVFSGQGELVNPPIGKLSHNIVRAALFVDAENFDYHLSADSPARNFGAAAGTVNGFSLLPLFQYVHPTCFESRTTVGAAIDAGAFEFGGGGGVDPSCSHVGPKARF
jgi:hypothetical protein